MPFGSGRKSDAAWSQVIGHPDAATNKVICKHCNTEVSAKIERIKLHLTKCLPFNSVANSIASDEDDGDIDMPSSSPSSVIPGNSGIPSNVSTMSSSTTTSSTRSAVSCQGPHSETHLVPCSSSSTTSKSTLKHSMTQPSVSSFAVKTSPALKQSLDLKIAKFFYANNIAFNAANSKEYHDMIEGLRPGYGGPSSEQIGGRLLDVVCENIDSSLASQLGGDAVITLIQDGWSSVRNDPIMATSIHTGTDSYLLETLDCGAEKKTAEYCADVAMKSIEYCKDKFGHEVRQLTNYCT